MHVMGDSSVREFLEGSVHFQNETVFTLYLTIFAVLTAICVSHYQLSKRIKKSALKPHDLKQQGEL